MDARNENLNENNNNNANPNSSSNSNENESNSATGSNNNNDNADNKQEASVSRSDSPPPPNDMVMSTTGVSSNDEPHNNSNNNNNQTNQSNYLATNEQNFEQSPTTASPIELNTSIEAAPILIDNPNHVNNDNSHQNTNQNVDQQHQHQQQEQQQLAPTNNSAITTSTVVISTSQIIEAENDLNKSCVDLGDDFKKNDDSIVVSQTVDDFVQALTSSLSNIKAESEQNQTINKQENSNDSESGVNNNNATTATINTINDINSDNDNDKQSIEIIDQKQIDNQEEELNKSQVVVDGDELKNKRNEQENVELNEKSNETPVLVERVSRNDDVENLVKDYEIPNFNNNDTNGFNKSLDNEQHQQQENQQQQQESNSSSPVNFSSQTENFVNLNKSEIESKIEEFKLEIESNANEEKPVPPEDNSSRPLEYDQVLLTKSIQDQLPVSKSEEHQQHTEELKPKVAEAAKPERRVEDEKFEDTLGSGSLLKKITQYGDEESTRPRNGQMVTISYEAFLNDTKSLVEQNESLSFILGDGDVVPALDLIVALMNRNEKSEVIAEPRHAYGSLGKQPDIPPNATLLYKIHLKEFKDVTDFNLMEPIERLSLAEAKKLRGNFYFNRQDFFSAISSYRKGLDYFEEENLKGNEDAKDLEKFLELRLALLMNLALSNFKLTHYREALSSLDEVLKVQIKHMKALYIKGKILMYLGETKEAIECLNNAHELDKNNVEIKKELSKAQAKHKVQYENEKKLYQKMISGVSSDDKDKSNKNNRSTNKSESSIYLTYVAAGLVIAAASIGVALFVKYKNII